MNLMKKRKCTNISIGLIFLFSGIEYAVILPTIWMYLQTLHAEPYFLGLGLSAFSLTGLLAGPLFGHWSDRTRKTKAVILFANLFEISGNFMYFMGTSKWLLLSSRLVAGIGTGAGASIFGYLTRATAPEDRSAVFAAVMACRQTGLLIGPAFNLFLRLCDFKLGPFQVNKYTSPGLFMCLMWLLLQVVVVLLYWDLPPRKDENGKDEENKPLVQSCDPETYSSINCNHTTTEGHESPTEVQIQSPFHSFSARKEYLREEVVVLLTAQFVTLFNQTALETMVTPLTQKYFGFSELENSVMYCLCGVEVIGGFFLVRWLSSRISDRIILAVGLFICNVSCVWCLVFLASPRGGPHWLLAEFIIGVFLQVLGLPFVAVSQVSLFSKLTAEKTQGFSQGLRRSVGGLATILGPLWAGGLTGSLYIMIGMMMALLILLTVMMALSFKYLVEPHVGNDQTGVPEDCG
ncbi:major facilitator superfamily domain-containing protein 8 [Erpetoichthys calabaricus]|uniref:Major facilitator superfamily domain-containing protein 8-like n=1 Tax=Erpetoichthys calabaricus TaxID=27687 RepID=A0A8C4RZ42_ERPCA|nr:major facilitator superfamily domain-containing protein 8 [Erpetoichthys calabaricus]